MFWNLGASCHWHCQQAKELKSLVWVDLKSFLLPVFDIRLLADTRFVYSFKVNNREKDFWQQIVSNQTRVIWINPFRNFESSIKKKRSNPRKAWTIEKIPSRFEAAIFGAFFLFASEIAVSQLLSKIFSVVEIVSSLEVVNADQVARLALTRRDILGKHIIFDNERKSMERRLAELISSDEGLGIDR